VSYALIRLKKTTPALEHGANTMLDTKNTAVLSWMRQAPGVPTVLVSVLDDLGHRRRTRIGCIPDP
jgi:hypothetical protein